VPPILRSPLSVPRSFITAGLLAAAFTAAPAALAAEPVACLDPDPAAWPAPAKPYFMIAFDTSGSMTASITNTNSCGYPDNRLGHGRCAIKNTIQAYSGQANFGLASYARVMTSCPNGTCANDFSGCNYGNLPNNSGGSGPPAACVSPGNGCGPEPNKMATNSSTRAGGNVLVEMLSDAVQPPPPTNVPALLSFVDNNCTGGKELFADGCTPLNGILRDMFRYYSDKWAHPSGTPSFNSPLTSVANGERACRPVSVILVTDGDETCDVDPTDPVNAAAALLNGFTKDGINWKVKTFVINFAGGSQATTDLIAAAGGTGSSFFATNETQLALALSNIIGGSVKPEVCDNKDNNCNGCTDEGFNHFCNNQPVASNCCAAPDQAARDQCLVNYQGSITPANPQGNLALLPCTNPAQQQEPTTWLCFDPGEKCDNIDNNCQAGVDETVAKCGNPLHCPTTEICNQQDDNCDGLVDEGNVCQGCTPSFEICDGCDNDCDGQIDEGITPIPCGLPAPPNCVGQITCKTIPGTFPPGTCQSGGFNACTVSPQAEICDGLDNNCNSAIDDGITPVACVPPGTPGGIVFGGTSQCKQGTLPCNGTCDGFIGPSPEICDGIDNDCDGSVDEGAPGTGLACGNNQPPCTPGTTACVGGVLVCQGGTVPKTEVCDGIDNDCDSLTDEGPLADAPAPGFNGCWDVPSSQCPSPCLFPPMLPDIAWCPPPGANCNNNGSLSPPCNKGTLICAGGTWLCQGPKGPSPEACDGIDNDCNNKVDDGTVIQVGEPCGSDEGDCVPGKLECKVGVLDCVGDVGPVQEVCDGKDNDCDGAIDNGIGVGGACPAAYDEKDYPGVRTFPPCQPGIKKCNGLGGEVCEGGVGPSPEICDGIDNDCDGVVDEVGAAPDGLDGTSSPPPPPIVSIGDECGVDTGECKKGKFACINGAFGCLGSQSPQPEQCDCLDNDCDGTADNTIPGGPSLCGADKDCVKAGNQCQCSPKCGSGEFPCPSGQNCQVVISSDTGMPLPDKYCLADPCTDCASATVKDANNVTLCAPEGTMLDNCVTPPVCACKGQNGCQEPCFGVTCPMGEVCVNAGPNAGKCAVDNCYNNPCQGCSTVCNQGSCVDNPCEPNPCPADQVCKPSGDFSTAECLPSCANVTCPSGQACVDGVCFASCSSPCPSGQACDLGQSPPACVADKCQPNPCTNGAYCDPVTGLCGNSPCEGVVCPNGEQCSAGQCIKKSTTTGSGGGSSAASGSSSASSGAGGSGAGGDPTKGVWGLPTGGGGCACEVGPGSADLGGARWALFALAIALGRLRKRPKQPRSIEGEVRQ
jgi:hypothetical protein